MLKASVAVTTQASRPLSQIFYSISAGYVKNSAENPASHIFSAEFQVTNLRLILRLAEFFKSQQHSCTCVMQCYTQRSIFYTRILTQIKCVYVYLSTHF